MKLFVLVLIFLNLFSRIVNSQVNYKIDTIVMKSKKINIGDRKILLTILNKKETKELILSFQGKKDINLSKEFDSDSYILKNNQVLLSHEGGGALYESKKDLIDLMKFLKKDTKSHPLENGLPFDIYYITHIDTIINEFANKINIDISKLNKTTESLKIVEEKLKKLNIDEFELEKEYLIYLITYCGEVIRTKVGGNWTLLSLSINNKNIYEPVIRVDQMREYSVLWPILKEFNEQSLNFSLVRAVDSEIEKYKIMDYILSKKQ